METILHQFLENASKFGASTCFLVKNKETGTWEERSWNDVLGDVTRLGMGLKSLGVGRGDSVALFSSTRLEWTIIDVAIMSIGGVTVPIYHTLGLDQILYIIDHSSSKIVFVENPELLEKIRERLAPSVKVILIEGKEDSVISFSDAMTDISGNVNGEYREMIRDVNPDDLATCIYTSGTTGEPKGAELTHANILGETEGLRRIFHFGRDEIGLLFLPLAHVVARAMQFYQLAQGCITAYAESIEKLPENLLEVRPHFMVVVPRVMEKVYDKVMKEVSRGSSFKRFVFSRSVGIGSRASRQLRMHKPLDFLTDLEYRLVKWIVFSKLHRRLGGRLRMVISGGAPLSKVIAEFFHAVGCLVLEGYGLTETMAAITINHPDDFKFGTVGKPLDAVQIRIGEGGEILVKGPQVFRGYRKPVDALDEDAFEEEWFKTGDIGEFSRDGFLRITGRKKELIVTSSGKNIVPQRVESVIKSSPYIKEVLVYGDRRKYLSALVVLDSDTIREFAKNRGLKYDSLAELMNDFNTYQLIKSEIECRNKDLARHETVKRFTIIDHEFTQERGELTPTLKMKRKRIYDMYQDVIEKMYE